MPCIIINGVEIDCADAIGGVAEIYLTEYTNVPQGNITAASGVITAMTCSSGKKFWTFQLEKMVNSCLHLKEVLRMVHYFMTNLLPLH